MTRAKNGRRGEVSNGERKSSQKTASGWSSGDRALFKMDALNKGKNVTFTIENPNKSETNKPFIKMKISGKDWVNRQKYAHKAPKQGAEA